MVQPRVETGAAGGEPCVSDVGTLIATARAGCARSLGELADRYRRYLLLVANCSLSPALRSKVGASDIVQETLLHFQQRFERFEGASEDELLLWLRRILYFRALEVARRFGGIAARDVQREVAIAELKNSSHSLSLFDKTATPCASLLAKEQLQNLEAAVAELSDEDRQVIQLRNFERKGFREIGMILDCSHGAARKRWVRAIDELRSQMNGHESR